MIIGLLDMSYLYTDKVNNLYINSNFKADKFLNIKINTIYRAIE